MAGRPPKPAAIRELEGHRGHRPIRHGPKTIPVIRARPPAWLDATAKRIWRDHSPELERLGMLTKVDLARLAGFCKAYSRYLQAEEALDGYDSMTYMTDTGQIKPRPEVNIAQTYLRIANQIGNEFGFSPSGRTRIDTPQPDPGENDFAEYD